MSTIDTVNIGSVIKLKGRKWTLEKRNNDVYTLTSETGNTWSGHVVAGREVEVILEADPAVGASCAATGATPLEHALAVATVHLGAVELGTRGADGTWECPLVDDDEGALAAHMLVFHGTQVAPKHDPYGLHGMPAHTHRSSTT